MFGRDRCGPLDQRGELSSIALRQNVFAMFLNDWKTFSTKSSVSSWRAKGMPYRFVSRHLHHRFPA
jgi:hypothetical protein